MVALPFPSSAPLTLADADPRLDFFSGDGSNFLPFGARLLLELAGLRPRGLEAELDTESGLESERRPGVRVGATATTWGADV